MSLRLGSDSNHDSCLAHTLPLSLSLSHSFPPPSLIVSLSLARSFFLSLSPSLSPVSISLFLSFSLLVSLSLPPPISLSVSHTLTLSLSQQLRATCSHQQHTLTNPPHAQTTPFNEVALPPVCVACTWLLGLQDSLFSVAKKFGNDWITVWSLNQNGNPDLDNSGTSIYYAHPYQIAQGESVASVMTRFGLNTLEISILNPGRRLYNQGDVVCIMPRWSRAVDRDNMYVCRDRNAPSSLNSTAVAPTLQLGVQPAGPGVVVAVQR